MAIIGRKEEIRNLDRYYNSGRPEFIALYGRRRVGKTYLIEQMYGDRLAFGVTGVLEGKRKDQETVFLNALQKIGYQGSGFKTWYQAFSILKGLLENSITKGKRSIVFIDELPCFDTIRAGFIQAFGDFWNDWCLKHAEIMLIVCGSATTWMIKNIINSHGGLHNRITYEMHIRQFTLSETESYLLSRGIEWDRLSIIQLYSATGGIPYYLSLIDPLDSSSAAIDHLFFSTDAKLENEYVRLFKSLYRTPEPYLKIIDILCASKRGMTREEICNRLGSMSDNGHLSEYLDNLIHCDFIRYYHVKDTRSNKLKKNGGIYQITDFFTLFHKAFMSSPTTDSRYWSNHSNSTKLNTWYGLAFERICMSHIEQIKKSLGIDRISTEYYSWRSKSEDNGAQIDMIIERADRTINLCEMKYSEEEYVLQKDEEMKLRNRVSVFKSETGTKKTIRKTLVTTYGLMRNRYNELFNDVVTMDDLFK